MRLLGLGDNVIDYYTNTGAVYPGGNAFNAAVHASILGAEAAYMAIWPMMPCLKSSSMR